MERDYPEGHPAASDYSGQPYTPPRAPYAEDFGVGHPARGGNNISDLDSPDGSHQRTVREWQASVNRTAPQQQQAVPMEAEETSAEVSEVTTTFTITGEEKQS